MSGAISTAIAAFGGASGGAAQPSSVFASFGGRKISLTSFDITLSSYGSVGHAVLRASDKQLADAKIDLYALATAATEPIEVLVTVVSGGKSSLLFGGEHVDTRWDYDADAIEIHCRSWAGRLVDQKRVLVKLAKKIETVLRPLVPGRTLNSAGVSSQNQQLGQIVSQICADYSLTPVLNISSGSSQIYGALYGSTDTVYMPIPQSMWAVLNQLARDTGNDIYDRPDRSLVFGTPGAGLPTIQLYYGVGTVPSSGVPIMHATVEHYSRRNSTFRVVVISYDPATAQTTIGRATMVGTNFGGQQSIQQGLVLGSAAQSIDKKMASIHASVSQVPLYTFHYDGLTSAQAEARAAGIAYDISKRELILHFEADIIPSILPTNPMTITSHRMASSFCGRKFYASQIHHTFRMPATGNMRGHRGGAQGLITRVMAIDVPTLASKASGEGSSL